MSGQQRGRVDQRVADTIREARLCGVTGTAIIQRVRERGHKWLHADEHIHVSRELADDWMAQAIIAEHYDMAEWCTVQNAYHAHRHTPIADDEGAHRG